MNNSALFYRLAPNEGLSSFGEVAQCCGKTPDAKGRIELAQSRQREFHLDASLASKEFVPFIHDHPFKRAQLRLQRCVREKQTKALGSCDQRRWQLLELFCFDACATIACP